jgi:hypothetical protein
VAPRIPPGAAVKGTYLLLAVAQTQYTMADHPHTGSRWCCWKLELESWAPGAKPHWIRIRAEDHDGAAGSLSPPDAILARLKKSRGSSGGRRTDCGALGVALAETNTGPVRI